MPSPPPKRVKLEESPTPPPEAGDEDKEHCIICLQDIADRTILPNCAHEKFCFECVVVWTEQSRKCPLCQQEIGPYLIHHVRSQFDYQKYFLPPLRSSPIADRPPPRSSYRQPSTRTARARVWGQREDRRREDDEQRAIEKRRWVYRHNLYAKHVASNTHTKYRPLPTPSQFASQPDLVARTTTFVNRELAVWNNVDADFLTTFVISLMKSLDLRSETAVKLLSEFLDMGNPYVEGNRYPNAEHFAHEVYSYVRSPFRELTVYDRHVQYDRPSDGSSPFEERPPKRWGDLPRSPRVSNSRRASDAQGVTQSRSYQPPGRSRSRERRDDRHRSRRRSPSRSRSRRRSPTRRYRSRSRTHARSPIRASRRRSVSYPRERSTRRRSVSRSPSRRSTKHRQDVRRHSRSRSSKRHGSTSPSVRSRQSYSPRSQARSRSQSAQTTESRLRDAPTRGGESSQAQPALPDHTVQDVPGKGKARETSPLPQQPAPAAKRERPQPRAPRQTALSSIQAHLGAAQNGSRPLQRRVKIDRKPLAERIADGFTVTASADEQNSSNAVGEVEVQPEDSAPALVENGTEPETGSSRLSAREIMARTRARLAALKAQDAVPSEPEEEHSAPAPQTAALRDLLLTRLEEEKKRLAAAAAPPASDAEERRLRLKARLAAEKRRASLAGPPRASVI